MAKPFDSLFKDLLERDPAGWVALAYGHRPGTATVVDSDIATLSGAADKVVHVTQPDECIVHFEAFAAWDGTVLPRATLYNAALHRRWRLPVETVLVVLRPAADHPSLTGTYGVTAPLSGNSLQLGYVVLRAWLLELGPLLTGPLSTLPLAVITDEASSSLPEVLGEIRTRLETEAPPELRREVWGEIFVLLGLRHPRETAVRLLGEIPGMRESDTYQMILDEGRAEGRLEGRLLGRLDGAKQALLLVAVPRLGEPDLTTRRRIEDEPDLSEVEAWLRRIMQIESWTELFPAIDR